MCVVNEQFELLKFVFDSVYVDMQYDENSLTFTAGSVCLSGVYSPWYVSEVVVVPYVVVTVMLVLLSVLHLGTLRECEGNGNAGVWSGRGVAAVSAYMGCTRGSGDFSSADDVLEISVVRGVGGVCDMYICFTWGGLGGVGGERIGFEFYQAWRNMEKVG